MVYLGFVSKLGIYQEFPRLIMFGNPENLVFPKKKKIRNFSDFFRNYLGTGIPKGDTEFPKILFPAFSIPDAKKFGNGPTLD